ncbi:MAG: MurR/RpiR family transcriptional regulator [Formosimonas sp.]
MSVTLTERISHAAEQLTKSERRVAEIILQQSQLVAFGTVSDLAQAAQAGVATVARLALKLGFSGFSDMQNAVRYNMASQLEPAAIRIKTQAGSSLENHLQVELENVQQTLGGQEPAKISAIVAQLGQLKSAVYVLSGNASRGVAQQFVEDLGALRPNVSMLEGNPVQIGRSIAQFAAHDVILALDLRRYDAWVIDAAAMAHAADISIISIADSVLSPLAKFAQHMLVVSATGAGPFDSHVGTLALLNFLNAGVAEKLRSSAADRLSQAEEVWHRENLLQDR